MNEILSPVESEIMESHPDGQDYIEIAIERKCLRVEVNGYIVSRVHNRVKCLKNGRE